MSIQAINMEAYSNAIASFQNSQKTFNRIEQGIANPAPMQKTSFADTLTNSLKEVNQLQGEKSAAVKSFVAGETQNVHELMITMQKASVAVSMTSAIRNKAMEAYRELSKLQF